MNVVVLTGRFVRDPEVREVGEKKTKVCDFTLAVDKNKYVPGSGSSSNYPNCQAWGKTAEFIGKYFKKGMKADLTGELETSHYTNKDGNEVYKTLVGVTHIQFGESKASYASAELPDDGNAEEPKAKVQAKPKAEPKREEPKKADDTQSILDEAGDDFMNIPDDLDSDEAPFA